jgi:hypothetical protein
MVIVGAALILAYGVLVVVVSARGVRSSGRQVSRPSAILARAWETTDVVRRRAVIMMGRTRAHPANDNALRRPLAAYDEALNAALATVEALSQGFGAQARDRRQFEEVAVQSLVAAHTLRRLANAAGACADGCEMAEASHRQDRSTARSSTPRHQRRAASPTEGGGCGELAVKSLTVMGA